MYSTPEGYRDAILSPDRSVKLFMHIGTGIDNTSADDITSMDAYVLPLSNEDQLVDANYSITQNLATFEGDGIPTAKSAGMVVPPEDPAEMPIQSGLWSDLISDADGNIDWDLSIAFSSVHSSALTIYTGEVNILEAEVVFSVGGSETHRDTYTATTDRLQIPEVHDYDRIDIKVTRIDQPYHHVRITEVEFGASITVSDGTLTGVTEYVAQLDPTDLRVPLHEVTFAIINEGHVYDYDSPSLQNEAITVGKPVMLSYQVQTDNGPVTVPCGRFYIRMIDMGQGVANVTADDPRVVFTDVHEAWTAPASVSIGDTLDSVCEALYVIHTCEESLYQMYPPRDLVFTEDTTYMDDIHNLLQLMGLQMWPDAKGVLQFRPYPETQSYGVVDGSAMYSFPQKQSNLRAYNYISVRYGDTGSYNIDLRGNSTAQAVNQISVSNPLVETEAEARTIAERVRANLHNEELSVQWVGDPSVEVGDMIGFPGRWSDARERRIVSQSIRYDGGMSGDITTVM